MQGSHSTQRMNIGARLAELTMARSMNEDGSTAMDRALDGKRRIEGGPMLMC